MENKKPNDDVLKKHIEKIVKPIFEKAAQEAHINPIRVGRVAPIIALRFLWQPHNYRRYYDFSQINFNPVTTPSLYKDPSFAKSRVGYEGFTYEAKNHNSEHHFNNIHGCRVIIRKNMAEVINKWYEKQWLLIEAETIGEVGTKIDERVKELNTLCDKALKEVIELFGGSSTFKVLKQRGEHGIHGEDFLDKIPENMVIQDTIFKKVYKHKVEMYNPAYIKNYISNRAIENIAPNITHSINTLGAMISNELKPVLNDLSEQIKLHLEVEEEAKKALEGINLALSKKPSLFAKKTTKKCKISKKIQSMINSKGELVI